MEIGTKVRTLYEHSETAVIVKPRKSALPKPGAEWFLIKFDCDGGMLYAHRNMLAARNVEARA